MEGHLQLWSAISNFLLAVHFVSYSLQTTLVGVNGIHTE